MGTAVEAELGADDSGTSGCSIIIRLVLMALVFACFGERG